MIPRNDATNRQIQAANPEYSTWLSANAGSGKTRVLTDRVARLLLDSVLPQNILCLTYTKAAASEMQNRLFRRLGEWTMLPSAKLKSELQELGYDHALTDAELANARTLFARAIETPGGLKIQTIHSFCSALLRRFPLEAGVSPRFEEIDDRSQKLIIDDIIEQIADTPNASSLDGVAAHFTGADLQGLVRGILASGTSFNTPQTRDSIKKAHGVSPDLAMDRILSDCFRPNDLQILNELLRILPTKGKSDLAAGDKLAAINTKTPLLQDLAILEDVFLTKGAAANPFSAKITGKTFPTKPTRETLSFTAPLDDWMLRVQNNRQNRLALQSADRSWALYQFACDLLQRYAQYKADRALLDFDDLIQKTKALLSSPQVAEWVLYRLDGGIDHILVDEAQDTSPDQWQVIERLTQEFTSGQGARSDRSRSLFVVGDKKQSIYSFQGADPAGFDQMRDEFSSKIQAIGKNMQSTTLDYSFRSAPEILNLVDTVFENTGNGLGAASNHIAFKSNLPGRVDLWPYYSAPTADKDEDWTNPVDQTSQDHQSKRLAQDLAEHIRQIVETQGLVEITDGKPQSRPVEYGDFLILIRSRQGILFNELHLAFKSAGLPTAGADRLKVMQELAVKDLTSLLCFLAAPADSLALAEALRSPLFGWSEQDLYSLAHNRETQHLWDALFLASDEHPQTCQKLKDLLNLTDFMRPYELLEYILIRMDGRKNLIARLGSEVEEVIDALLSQALAYERAATPSLTDFLIWLEAGNLELKRQMDSAGNQIRIMTIHGAKGLEAPIVVLPETAPRKAPSMPQILQLNGTPAWLGKKEALPDVLAPSIDAYISAQQAEYDRLLYVALTRAENWIIAMAAAEIKDNADCWYTKIQNALQHLGASEYITPNGAGLRYQTQPWDGDQKAESKAKTDGPIQAPDGFDNSDTAPPKTPPAVINPSHMGGAKTIAGGDARDDALEFGTWVHKLLEVLPNTPKSDWAHIARSLIPDEFYEPALKHAIEILQNPTLAHVFAANTLAEVDIAGHVPTLNNRAVFGSIDRLIIEQGTITAVDFKTNSVAPNAAEDTPDGVLRQMAVYFAALQDVYPDHDIQIAILWTATQNLMPIPKDLLTITLRSLRTS